MNNENENMIYFGKSQTKERMAEIKEEMKKEETKSNEQNENVISFPKQNKITDEDLKNLFMGLVKLVKKTEDLELEQKYKQEREKMDKIVEKTMVDLLRKEVMIRNLEKENEELKKRSFLMQEKLTEILQKYKKEG